jgi:hypothetical protein
VRFKEKLQSFFRIEPGARRLNLKNGTQGRHINAKLVGRSQQLRARQPSSASDEIHEFKAQLSILVAWIPLAWGRSARSASGPETDV